jgi:uncharacterized lipoprotein YddW (UPF0748 family)
MAFRTADDITQIMQNCQEAGFNHVLFQVRGNGTVFYPSQIEPWAEQFDFHSPGFDPLAHACKEAHARGLTLQAWVNVMPAWRGLRPPPVPEQLYNRHPEWFWYDQHGRRQALCDFYVSLNPCLPQVRAYLVSVCHELAANYDVDGLHMDYIRFPNEPPATPAGSNLDYPRDAETLALYKTETGKTPDDDADAWNRWRTEQVTRLVADIRTMLRKTRPAALLTASVGTDPTASLRHFRDDLGWARAGLIDMAFPMDYKPDLEKFLTGLEPWLPLRDQVVVVPGLWTAGGSKVVCRQIQAAVQATGNFCLFSYASLYSNAEDAAPGTTSGPARPPATNGKGKATRPAATRPSSDSPVARELLRRQVVPVIQSLAATHPTT